MKGDFLGFSFNGVHSDDMGIVRMSDGSRYSTDLTPEIEDRTNSVPGRDGVYFYGSDFKDGKISVKVAFDQLTDRQFRALRKWLGVKEPAPLIFDEFPFKKYMAKLASAPVFDYVCFDERRRWPSETAQDGVRIVDRTTVTEDVPYTEDLTVENGSSVTISRKPETVTVTYESEQLTAEDFDYVSETGELNIHITDVESGDAINVTVDYTIEESTTEIEREQVYPHEYADDVERIYKGEGTIDFEIPFPYAIGAGVTVEDIRADADVPEQWEGASYLPTAAEYVEHGINQYDDGVIPVYNCGDIPTGFKLTLEPGSSSGSEGTATGNPITVNDAAGEVSDLTVDLEPIQDLHGYNAPWAAGLGKNKLIEVSTENGWVEGFLADNYGYIHAPDATNQEMTSPFVAVTGGETYTFSYALTLPEGLYYWLGYLFFDANKQSCGSRASITGQTVQILDAPSEAAYVRVSLRTYGTLEYVQLEQGASSTSYVPYSNICPITGHDSVTVVDTGKNLLNIADAEIGTAWNGASNSARARLVIPIEPNTDYVLSMNGTMSLDGVHRALSTQIPSPTNPSSVSFPYSFNSGSNTYLTLGFNKTAIAQSDVEALKLQLEHGTSASDYEAYKSTTTTVTLPHTVYGGTVGVTSGTGKDKIIKVTGSDIASISLAGTSDAGKKRALIMLQTQPKTEPVTSVGDIKCNVLPSQTANATYMKIDGISYASTLSGVYTYKDDLQTVADWQAFIEDNGMEFTYELATPTDLTTTPTRVTLYEGSNTLTSNGDMDLTYVKTTTGGITYKDKHLDIDFSIMPFEENNDTAVVVDTFNRVIRGVDSGVLYNKCIVGGDFFLLDPSTDIDDSDEQISLALENSQFSSITYDYLFY